MRRISLVGNININIVTFSSIMHIGDNVVINLKSRALAVQRELPNFLGNEGNFADYPLFTRPIPQPLLFEKMSMDVRNESIFIKVRQIDIVSISSSSVFQAGSTHTINSEARIKHFRQLLPKAENKP